MVNSDACARPTTQVNRIGARVPAYGGEASQLGRAVDALSMMLQDHGRAIVAIVVSSGQKLPQVSQKYRRSGGHKSSRRRQDDDDASSTGTDTERTTSDSTHVPGRLRDLREQRAEAKARRPPTPDLSDAASADLYAAFQAIDAEGSNTIDAGKLRHTIASMGYGDVSQEDATAVLQALGAQAGGVLGFADFARAMGGLEGKVDKFSVARHLKTLVDNSDAVKANRAGDAALAAARASGIVERRLATAEFWSA
jgi:hypothetical protein